MAANDDPNYGSWLVTATTIFLIWGLLFSGLRAWAKFKKSWTINDIFFGSALLLAIGQSISIYLSVSYSYGHPISDVSTAELLRQKKTLYASQMLYVLSVGMSKFSTTQLLCTLARAGWQKKASIVVNAATVPWILGSTLAIALRGDISFPWDLTHGTGMLYTRWLGVEASGLGLELIMWILSVCMIWGLNMPLGKRLGVVAIFGLRFLLIPIVAGRLYFLSRTNGFLTLFDNTLSDIFTQGAMQYSIMAECTTSLKPFLQPFHSAFDWSSAEYALSSNMNLSTNPKRDPYGELSNQSGSRSRDKGPARVASKRVGQREAGDDLAERLRYAGNYSSFSTNVQRDSKKSRPVAEDDIELLHGQNRGDGIHQTTTISVYNESI